VTPTLRAAVGRLPEGARPHGVLLGRSYRRGCGNSKAKTLEIGPPRNEPRPSRCRRCRCSSPILGTRSHSRRRAGGKKTPARRRVQVAAPPTLRGGRSHRGRVPTRSRRATVRRRRTRALVSKSADRCPSSSAVNEMSWNVMPPRPGTFSSPAVRDHRP
jgi:hypothetical protein